APTIANVAFDAKRGVFAITFQDNVGLNLSSLLDPAAYAINQGKRGASRPTAVSVVGAGTGTETIAVTMGKGRRVAAGKYGLTVNSSLVQDLSGNALAGTFSGGFPTGGPPGSTFRAVYTVKSRGAVRGPTAAAVIVGKAHPKNLVVHQLSV